MCGCVLTRLFIIFFAPLLVVAHTNTRTINNTRNCCSSRRSPLVHSEELRTMLSVPGVSSSLFPSFARGKGGTCIQPEPLAHPFVRTDITRAHREVFSRIFNAPACDRAASVRAFVPFLSPLYDSVSISSLPPSLSFYQHPFSLPIFTVLR